LDYLQNISADKTEGIIFGELNEILSYRKDDETKPFGTIKIKFHLVGSEGKFYETVTDINGKYEIRISAGRYEINLVLPEYAQIRELGSDRNEIEVKPNGCVKARFTIESKSKISGKLTSFEEKPVANLTIELINFDTKEWTTSADTNGEGNFSLEGISSGKYLIAINREISPHAESPYPTFYYSNAYTPVKAKVLAINLRQNIENLIFQLPSKLEEQTITGTVVWENGKPAPNTRVEIEDTTENTFFRKERVTETDSSGKFVLKGFVGRSYNLKAKFEKYEDLTEEEAKKEMSISGKISYVTSADSPPRYVRITRGEAKIEPFKVANKTISFKIVLKEK